LNAAQIAQVAANAGFAGNDLVTAVAIALAESNPPGNPQSYNPEPAAPGGTPQGQGSYGLWQIYLKAHPEDAGVNLFDPQTNANAAYALYRQHGFAPWTTYTSGKFQAFLPTVLAAIQPSAPLVLDASTGLPVSDVPTPDQAAAYASLLPGAAPPLTTTSPGFGQILLWAGLGLFALWIFEEAT
jgi:hypothetical protein